jgi:hypothetical protein
MPTLKERMGRSLAPPEFLRALASTGLSSIIPPALSSSMPETSGR